MLRFWPVEDASQAARYYSKSDAGYYLKPDDLHQEWGGKGAAMLGLSGAPPDYEHFSRLIRGLDPHTGAPLTARLNQERLAAWDATASLPKGVTSALECGDTRIRDVMWASGREAMADVERYATTRVRKGGRMEDRVTGCMLYYATEHAETRPTKQDNLPDWDRHVHFVILNLTHDHIEDQWKALKYRPMIDRRKLFSHRFDMRMSHKLAELGYEIEISWKPDGRYHSWDIKGIPESVIAKNSRRSAEVEETEQTILEKRQEAAEAAGKQSPERLSAIERDRLGATSRQNKRKDVVTKPVKLGVSEPESLRA